MLVVVGPRLRFYVPSGWPERSARFWAQVGESRGAFVSGPLAGAS
jgi:hypothetical protein